MTGGEGCASRDESTAESLTVGERRPRITGSGGSTRTAASSTGLVRDGGPTRSFWGSGSQPGGAGAGRSSRPTLTLVPSQNAARFAEPITEAERAEMCRLYEAGLSIMKVAERVGRGSSTVRRHLLKAGVELGPQGVLRGPHPLQVPHAEMIRTAEMYRSGMSAHAIGRELGLHFNTVRRRLRYAGEPIRPRSESNRLSSTTRVPRDVEQRIVAMYRAGVPVVEIAAAAGVVRSTVTRVVKRNGLKIRRQRKDAPVVVEVSRRDDEARVDNRLLREAYQQSSVTASEIAFRLDWTQRGCADTSRVLRALGLMPDVSSASKGSLQSFRTTVRSGTAALMADALGLDPWEVGA